MKTSEILEKAHARISQPGAHAREAYARDTSGRAVHYRSPLAVRWCSVGAVYAEHSRNGNDNDAVSALNRAARKAGGARSIFELNDLGTREQLDAAFHLAIAEAKEQEQETAR